MRSIRKRSTRTLASAGMALLLGMIGAGNAHGYEHRQSTPSFGVQFGFGRLFGSETFQIPDWPLEDRTVPYRFDLDELHDQWGPSAHVSLRFVLDRSHALGFGFDDIRYKRHSGFTAEERNVLPRWVKFTTFHADYYLYFQRKERVTYYIAPCMGIQQRELRFKGSEVGTQEFRFLYGGGLGVEYFLRRSFSIDAGGHILAMRGGRGTSVAVQPALGFHVYVF